MTNSRLADAALSKYRNELAEIEAKRAQEAAEQEELRSEWLAQETSKLAPTYTRLFLAKMGLPAGSELGDDLLWYLPPTATTATTFQRRQDGTVAVDGAAFALVRRDALLADIDAITIRAVVDDRSEDENPLQVTLVDEENHGNPETIVSMFQLGRLIAEARERLEAQATARRAES
ncbi:hypothetical protein [Leifsonia sp. C5G2]|uniref:hypothetical protein n=1 Tax=Leifsonia sp. C5G2 TaxID=2735269 RepID=UPI0015845EB0|nr:hypothetical protein [Leifsonia sp. C5G2]NUU08412.1 hypothetical protein [Leifsonia sp. C5G2]